MHARFGWISFSLRGRAEAACACAVLCLQCAGSCTAVLESAAVIRLEQLGSGSDSWLDGDQLTPADDTQIPCPGENVGSWRGSRSCHG